MVDKKLENNIKKTKEFIEIWSKFRNIFDKTLSENILNHEREKEFLSTKPLVDSRFDDLMDSLGAKPLRRFTTGAPLYSVLSVDKLSAMSDEKTKELEKNWDESKKFLKALISRLEKKKRKIEGFNRFFLSLKRRFKKERT